METPAAGNVFGNAAALCFKLEFFVVRILEGMTNIHELLAIGDQHFNQNPSSGDAVLPLAEVPLLSRAVGSIT